MSAGLFLLLAAIGIAIGMGSAFRAPRLWLAATLFAATCSLAAAVSILASGSAWDWQPQLIIGGELVHLQLDAIGAFFLALLSVLGGAGTLYSHEYWTDKQHPGSAPSGRAWWVALLAFMALVILSANGLHFLIAWELFAVCGYFLITLERHRTEVRKAGWLYLAASHAGTLCLFAFFALLAARTGSWQLGPMREPIRVERSARSPLISAGLEPGDPSSQSTTADSAASSMDEKPLKRLELSALTTTGLKPGANEKGNFDPATLAPLFWLALFGFGLKAGLFPLHIWLPSAHSNAPSHVSAIFSGMAIKMGIYGIVRFSGWLPIPDEAGWVVAALGVVSAVLGVAFALGQHDLKRLLAYHSVENIGIILIGLGFAMIAATHGQPAWGQLALVGGLLHVWNHGLFKALLFLGAGSVLHATGTREMSKLGGLWRAMPWTASLFTLGAVAISGLPPLNGFVSELLVYLGLFDAATTRSAAAWAAIPAAIFLAMTGALALACFVKVCGIVFLGLPRSGVERAPRPFGSKSENSGSETHGRDAHVPNAHECGWAMRVPMLVLGGACVVIGLAPVLFWPAVAHAASVWEPDWSTSVIPAPLFTLGLCNVAFTFVATLVVTILWARVRRNSVTLAGTWDCGYAAPTPRMQYTAGSFAGIITGWFGWILRPQRHAHLPEEILPTRARFEEHTPETVLEKIVEPGGNIMMTISTAVRRLQHGRVQAYILYLLIGLGALALIALMGGAR